MKTSHSNFRGDAPAEKRLERVAQLARTFPLDLDEIDCEATPVATQGGGS